MKTNMRRALCATLSLIALLLTACSGSGDGKERATDSDSLSTLPNDSDAVRLALLHTIDCLPYYYAAERGYFQQNGVAVVLLSYASQMDCDTAIVGNTRAVGVTDLMRAGYYKNEGRDLAVLASTDGAQALVASGGLRLKDIKQLKLRTVAASRFSADSYYSRMVFDEAGISQDDALSPQINNYNVRTAMLDNNQVDAAILPEPFVTLARLRGHNVLMTLPKRLHFGCLTAQNAVLQRKGFGDKVTALLKAYNMAVDSLNASDNAAAACRHILENTLKLPAEVVDSLKLPKYRLATMPQSAEMEAAQKFMRQNGAMGRHTSLATMVDSTYCVAAKAQK